MNVAHLNFLTTDPLPSWFDYHVNRDHFQKEVLDKNDPTVLRQLFDQFVENALAAIADAKNPKKKKLEPEDVLRLEEKSENLWRFAWTCAAQLNWNLEELLRCSSTIKVYSMMARLFECTFNVNDEADVLGFLMKLEPRDLNPRNLFVAWMYARLVMLVDRIARVPPFPPKPTVSDPQKQVDPALVEWEKEQTFIANVRKHVRNAAAFLDRLIELKPTAVEIPTAAAFGFSAGRIPDYVTVGAAAFLARIKGDMFVAHLNACHVKTARRLLLDLLPTVDSLSNVDPLVRDLFAFNPKMLDAYRANLMPANAAKRARVEIDPFEFDLSPPSTSAHQPAVVFRTDGHKDVLRRWAEVKTERAEKKTVVHPPPTDEEIHAYVRTGPALWRLMHSYDYEQITRLSAECKVGGETNTPPSFRCPDHAAAVSPIFGGLIGDLPHGEATLFWLIQAEKLVDNWDLLSMGPIIKTFAEKMLARIPNTLNVVGYELLRVRLKVATASNGNPLVNPHDFFTESSNASTMLQNALNRTPMADFVQQIASWFFAFLMNSAAYDTVLQIPKTFSQLQSPYVDFARIVVTVMNSQSPEAARVQWNYLSAKILDKQVFDLAWRPNLPAFSDSQQRSLTNQQFLSIISMMKNQRIIEYLLSFLICLRNELNEMHEPPPLPYFEKARTNGRIYEPLGRAFPRDVFRNPASLDLRFIDSLIERLLATGLHLWPNSAVFVRQMGDFEYSRRQFAATNAHFVLLLNLVESGLHTDGNVAQIVSDEVIAKIVHCFFETGMFTLAAVSGQLLAEVEWHLACIPGIVSQTPHTHDAGKDVFPFLYNMSIFEAMAEAYDRLNLNVYYMYLTKLCPTKAMTQANSADVLEEEKRRRRSRFLEVIFKSVRFQSNMQTRTALLML